MPNFSAIKELHAQPTRFDMMRAEMMKPGVLGEYTAAVAKSEEAKTKEIQKKEMEKEHTAILEKHVQELKKQNEELVTGVLDEDSPLKKMISNLFNE